MTQPDGRQVPAGRLDNRELDKLVGALGRSRATWRRALLLHEWLLGLGHAPDDRLCTTLIRVCAQHGQVRCCSLCCAVCCAWTLAAQGVCSRQGPRQQLTVAGNLLSVYHLCEPLNPDEAHLLSWSGSFTAWAGGTQALSALNIYDWMRARVKEGGAGLCPTVFTYTAAMRAALSAGLVDRALKARTLPVLI